MHTGNMVTVNGSKFTVSRVGEHMVFLTGKRGGKAILVQNVNSGRWSLLRGARTEEIRSMTVSA